MKYFDIMGFTEKFVFRGEEGGFHAAGLMGRAVFEGGKGGLIPFIIPCKLYKFWINYDKCQFSETNAIIELL